MKIELQKGIVLIYLYDTLLYIYTIRSYADMRKIYNKYKNKAYKVEIIDINKYDKIDRTIFKLYDYHEEI